MEAQLGLTEYTIEVETRPMVSLDSEDLNRLQRVAASEVHMSDPVFALDESKGSILAVFQVWAATAALAAALGCWLFFNTLVETGLSRSADEIEMISVSKTPDGQEDTKVPVQLLDMEESNT